LQADREAQAEARRKAEKSDPLVASPASGGRSSPNRPDRKTPSVAEPQPGPKQQEISGPQRSDTPMGWRPEGPERACARRAQEAVGKNTPALRHGDGGCDGQGPRETVPSAKQEDVAASTPQRSNTESGQAEPKPPGEGRRGPEARRLLGQPGEGTFRHEGRREREGPKAPVKKTTRTGTAKRPSRNKS
jgi:hypothetical protein